MHIIKDFFPIDIPIELIDIIIGYCRKLPNKHLYITKKNISNDDIPLDTTDLTIDGCHQFTAKENLENILRLEIINSHISHIPDMMNVVWIKCEECNIEIINNLPNCEILHGSNNKIHKVKNINAVQVLDLHRNPLNKLPPLPECTWLNISNTRLHQLPDSLNKCRVIKCQNTFITEFPLLPSIKKINNTH